MSEWLQYLRDTHDLRTGAYDPLVHDFLIPSLKMCADGLANWWMLKDMLETCVDQSGRDHDLDSIVLKQHQAFGRRRLS